MKWIIFLILPLCLTPPTLTHTSLDPFKTHTPYTFINNTPLTIKLHTHTPTHTLRAGRLYMMFENFTEKAIKVILLAQEESRRSGHNFVGTEQIFLGLIGQTNGVAGRLLKNLGVTLKEARVCVENILGKGTGFVAAEIPFTPRAKQSLQSAILEAKILHHTFIDTEHLLLGVLKEDEGNISKLIERFDLDNEKLKTSLIKLMNENEEFTTVGGAIHSRSTPVLKEFSIDLTEKATKGQLDPVVGRTKEIDRLIQILARRTKSNPVLIGEPGVGKTAIAEGLAQRIATHNIPNMLQNKRVCLLDIGLLVAGTKYRGEFEERLKKIMDDVKKAGNIILVIDEIHTLVGAGAGEGALDAANLLKPALARNDFQCIGATTVDEYKKHFEKDSALERRFQPIYINEPTLEESIEILRGLSPKYERFHNITYTDEALVLAAKYAQQYIADRYLPDKAIDLIDEAGSNVKIRFSRLLQSQNFQANPTQYNFMLENLNNTHTSQSPILDNVNLNQTITVQPYHIAEVMASWTGIELAKLTKSDSERLLEMERYLQNRIVGQLEAVSAVSRAIRRAKSGVKDPGRPIASFLFSGPTGVGKSELSKVLAHYLFGSDESIIRLDMSEYMERFSISKLIGSSPGYVGYEEGGQLTEAVRRKPYSVILFDEVEKAHPDVFNMLLQILEDGHLTDAKGRTVDFKNCLIILTSNLGSKVIERASLGSGGFGFDIGQDGDRVYTQIKSLVQEELKSYFRPEFLNRLDEIIIFKQLNQTEIMEIADMLIDEIIQRVSQHKLDIVVTQAVKNRVISEGYDRVYGARSLRRCITRLIEDPLAEALLNSTISETAQAVVDIDKNNKIIVYKRGETPTKLNVKLHTLTNNTNINQETNTPINNKPF